MFYTTYLLWRLLRLYWYWFYGVHFISKFTGHYDQTRLEMDEATFCEDTSWFHIEFLVVTAIVRRLFPQINIIKHRSRIRWPRWLYLERHQIRYTVFSPLIDRPHLAWWYIRCRIGIYWHAKFTSNIHFGWSVRTSGFPNNVLGDHVLWIWLFQMVLSLLKLTFPIQ